jgi:hypothetical protein
MTKNLLQVKRGITSAKQTLLVLALLLVAVACTPAQNASPSPTAEAALQAPSTISAPAVMTETSTAQFPTATRLPSATATTPASPTWLCCSSGTVTSANVTPRQTATNTAAPAATNAPSATDTPAWLPSSLQGTVVGFESRNGMFRLALDDGTTLNVQLRLDASSPGQTAVIVVPLDSQSLGDASYYPVTQPLTALEEAVRLHAPARLYSKDNVVQAVFLTLPNATASAFLTETTAQRTMDASPTPWVPTPTPAGFVPTPTPFATPWFVDMPWGKIDLNLSIDQSNAYAMTVRCWRQTVLIDANLLPLWATNPNGIHFGHPNGRAVLEVKVVGKDADWSVDSQGQKYFNAYVVAWQTPVEATLHHFALRIYDHAPLATNMPVDSRLDGGARYDVDYAPVPTTLTDINQVRIGQIYEVIEGYLSWGGVPAVDNHWLVLISQAANNFLGIYTVPIAPEGTCAYAKDMMEHGYWATPPPGDDWRNW